MGFSWTPERSTKGLNTAAITDSSPHLKPSYDSIVIGSGFAGLIAARDISQHGSVLLLEARDRIGGRTWTAQVFGEDVEMGGTWVHWNQPHVYSEIAPLRSSQAHEGLDRRAGPRGRLLQLRRENPNWWTRPTLTSGPTPSSMPFFTIDGLGLRDYLPRPHEPMRSPGVRSMPSRTRSRCRIAWISSPTFQPKTRPS